MNTELLKSNPDHLAFRTGKQGVEGEFWYYESHFRGFSFKFVVPENVAKEINFEKIMKVSDLLEFVLIKGKDYR